jgi:hypothetical protein
MTRAPLARIALPDWLPLVRGKGNRETPLVILGTGGSGTRAIVSLAHAAGYFMGTDLNRAEDSRDIGKFIGRWPNRYLRRSDWIERMWSESGRSRFPYPMGMRAARYGERFLEGGYLRLRYEDVCADPGGAAVRLVDFLDCPVPRDSMRKAAVEAIQPSSSTGRWKEREPGKIRAVERLGGEALREFGYL